MNQTYAIRVLINTPAKQGAFDYAVPAELRDKIKAGQAVIVPFHNQPHQGLIWQTDVIPQVDKLKPIHAITDETPVLTPAQLRLAEKIAERSLCSISDAVNPLLNDKLRRVATFDYLWLDTAELNAPNESPRMLPGFPAEDDKAILLSQVKELFRQHEGRLSEDVLNDHFKKALWQKLMKHLIDSKKIRREAVLKMPESKEKLVPALRIRLPFDPTNPPKLSKQAAAQSRRESVLRLLSQYPNEALPLSQVYQVTGANNADIKILESLQWVSREETRQFREHAHYMRERPASDVTLTAEQQTAVDTINRGTQNGGQPPILLHGVTGSGKTEVYLRATAEALRLGKQVLMLVPEIALTPQILSRFERRFPGLVGVYHSELGDGERFDTWQRGRDGQFRIIIGPRSALAVPLPDLGLILVDECHEDSYYQTNARPYFSAVRAAADYAEISGAQLVLGSATPTVAQMFKAELSHWTILRLTQRATGVKPPRVLIVDMREELRAGNAELFSRALLTETQRSLDMGKQAVYFLNRRGSHAYTFCHNCGFDFKCPNCGQAYAWHASQNRFVCHLCGGTASRPDRCPQCGSDEIRQFGAGVETAELLLREKLPQARIIRMDSDIAAHVGSREQLLGSFARHEADILIGTRLIAKGLDFPDVRLTGVILADVGSNFQDYRVDEHNYQLLTQVAGRAGRAADRGLAILQTFCPDRYSVRAAAIGSYDGFYRKEIQYRKNMGYPPFSRFIRLEFRAPSAEKAEAQAGQWAAQLKGRIRQGGLRSTHIIGPAPCFFPLIGGEHRWQLILRGNNPAALLQGMDLSQIRVESDPPSLL